MQIRVLCVDDHPIFREGIAAVIAHEKDMTLVGTAATGRQAIEAFRLHKPDVVLMDLRLPDMSGIEAVTDIRNEFPHARIIMLTTTEGDWEVKKALSAGCLGYMLKSTPFQELVDVVRKVHRGQKHVPAEVAQSLVAHMGSEALSEREIDVLRRMAEGDRNRDIGDHLSISELTVKAHVRRIMEKLGAKDRTEAVAIGVRRGLVHF